MLYVKRLRKRHVILKLERVMLLFKTKRTQAVSATQKCCYKADESLGIVKYEPATETHHCALSNLLRSYNTITICIQHFILSYCLLGLQSSSFKNDFLHQNFVFVSLIPRLSHTSSITKPNPKNKTRREHKSRRSTLATFCHRVKQDFFQLYVSDCCVRNSRYN